MTEQCENKRPDSDMQSRPDCVSKLNASVCKQVLNLFVIFMTLYLSFTSWVKTELCFNHYASPAWYDVYLPKNSLLLYLSEHGRQYPAPLSWCDGLSEMSNLYNDRGDKAVNCAVNPEAFELGEDAPDDMVMFFGSQSGWNLCGGPELALPIKSKRLNVVLADFSVVGCRLWELSYLKWSVDDPGIVPDDGYRLFVKVLVVLSAVWSVAVLWNLRQYWEKHKIIIITAALLSASAGFIVGTSAEILYTLNMMVDYNLGSYTGTVICLLSGLSYVCFVLKWLNNKYIDYDKAWPYNCCGFFFGILASVVFHLLAIIAYREQSYATIIAGLGYGAWCGIIIGSILGLMLKCLYVKKEKSKINI